MLGEFPIIRTHNYLLRQFRNEDLDNVFLGLSHEEVIKYYGVSFKTPEETKAQMKFFTDLENDGTGIWWAVCSPDDKVFFGACGFNNLSREHKKAEIGFWLLPGNWGKGIMQEVIPEICAHAFSKLNLHRIEGFVETENKNSKSLMHKLNFCHEGTMKDCEMKNGRFISIDIYSKLNDK